MNVIHSIDAFILRELLRRCNYDDAIVSCANELIEAELLERHMNGWTPVQGDSDIDYFGEQFVRSGQASVVILPFLNSHSIECLGTAHLKALKRITNEMLQYRPFPVITIHDSFAAHANNVNWVRHWYKEILAELADSEVLSDILSQIHESPRVLWRPFRLSQAAMS